MRRDDKSLSVLVCRGSCCGSFAKHPGVDHEGHLRSLTGALADVAGARLWAVDCLDCCERSNVVVVRTRGQRQWFGEMLADADVDALADWLRGGAPGDAPAGLLPHMFDPDALKRATPPMAPLQEGALVDWVVDTLAAGGGWTIGHRGRAGEFDPAGAEVDVERAPDGAGGTIIARTSSGEMRLHISSDTRAFFVGEDAAAGAPEIVVLACIGDGEPHDDAANTARSALGSIEVLTPGAERSARVHVLPAGPKGSDALPFGIVLPKGFMPGAVHFRAVRS